MIYSILEWVTSNDKILDLCISFLSFLVTSLLTVLIISQTSRLAKRQEKQEETLNKQQEELQKRQIRIDIFEYKNNIYHALYKVFQMTSEIETLFEKVPLENKAADKLNQLFDLYREQLKIDVSETMWLFKQAQYILPYNIYESVGIISKHFDELTGDIGKLKLFPTILDHQELDHEKKQLVEDIKYRCKEINSHIPFIETIMPAELFIGNLDR